jgi:actin-like ATPase involved in cell morphogenesis
MGYALGIDLGTTFTCAVTSRDGREQVVQLGGTANTMPSVVSVRDDGTFLTGEAAERRALTDPSRTVREFKRRFGDEAPYVIGGAPYGTETLVGHLLRSVLDAVTELEGQPPEQVALTHPADYGPYKLDLLEHAAHLAGVGAGALLLVPEPVAAAIAYAERTGLAAGAHLLVYDLGGGTFDAAVVRIEPSGPVVVGTPEGLARLGGIDFDQAVLAHVERATGGAVTALDSTDADARTALARLRAECRSAKEALSDDTESEIPVLLPQLRTSVRLTREELESMVVPRLTDTAHVLERVVATAGLAMSDIDAVLLVGGSSRMPAVAQLVREHTGRPVAVDTNPKTTVAAGAAVLAGRAIAARTPAPPAVVTTSPTPTPTPTPTVAPIATPPLAPSAAPAEPAGRAGTRSRRGLGIAAGVAAVAGMAVAGIVLLGGDNGDDRADGVAATTTIAGAAATPTPTTVVDPTTTAASDATTVPSETAAATTSVAGPFFDGQSIIGSLPGETTFGDARWKVTNVTTWGQGADRVVTVDVDVTNLLPATALTIDGATELAVRLGDSEFRSAEVGGEAVVGPGAKVSTWYMFRDIPEGLLLDGATFTVESTDLVPAQLTLTEAPPTPSVDVATDIAVPTHDTLTWHVGVLRAGFDALVDDGADGGYTTSQRRAGDGYVWLAVELVATTAEQLDISSDGTVLVVDGETLSPWHSFRTTVAAGESRPIDVGFLVPADATTFELRLGTADDGENTAAIVLPARPLIDQLTP